jgi:hypothetical protein
MVAANLNKALKALEPYMVTQPDGEGRRKLGLGEKSLSFLEKSYILALQNPKMAPEYLDMVRFAINFSNVRELRGIQSMASQLLGIISKRRRVSGEEAMSDALIFYESSKRLAGRAMPGAEEVHRDLRKRFAGRKEKTANPNNSTPDAVTGA